MFRPSASDWRGRGRRRGLPLHTARLRKGAVLGLDACTPGSYRRIWRLAYTQAQLILRLAADGGRFARMRRTITAASSLQVRVPRHRALTIGTLIAITTLQNGLFDR